MYHKGALLLFISLAFFNVTIAKCMHVVPGFNIGGFWLFWLQKQVFEPKGNDRESLQDILLKQVHNHLEESIVKDMETKNQGTQPFRRVHCQGHGNKESRYTTI